jgi:Copper amine oxidase, enzyme domain
MEHVTISSISLFVLHSILSSQQVQKIILFLLSLRGDFPNQNPLVDGLPVWTQRDADLTNQDLVVWHVFGMTHVSDLSAPLHFHPVTTNSPLLLLTSVIRHMCSIHLAASARRLAHHACRAYQLSPETIRFLRCVPFKGCTTGKRVKMLHELHRFSGQ